MSRPLAAAIEALHRELARHGRVAVAVSGGIDSLTLAAVAHGCLGSGGAGMFHSRTASVPQEATSRTERLARQFGWRLRVIDASEFAREEYLANPVNRCFYCKQSLYAEIARHTSAQVVSGANTDDLREYRPGLEAARDAGARHPFIEAGIDKATIRAIAREVGLGEIADIPASPCLSSRVETGIRIAPPVLARIDRAESVIRARLPAATAVRCRVRASGVVAELDAATLSTLHAHDREELARALIGIFGAERGVPAFAPYRTGSAFLLDPAAAP